MEEELGRDCRCIDFWLGEKPVVVATTTGRTREIVENMGKWGKRGKET